MPGINDIMIDATTPAGVNEAIRNSEEHNNSNKVVMPSPRSKTVILPKKNVTNDTRSSSSNDRVTFDISSLGASPEEKEAAEDIHESFVQDILSGKDPMLYDYIENKTKEMNEWVAEKEDEAILAQQEKELEEGSDDTTLSSLNTSSNNDNLVFVEEEDYANNSNDNIELMEDEDIMSEINKVEDSVEEIDNDMIEEDQDNDLVEEELVEEAKEEEPIKKEEAKPEEVITSDIDLDELETATTHIDGLDEEEDEEETKESQKNEEDDTIKHLQQLATERLKPVSKNLNISSFTVLKKPIINTKFLEQKPVKVAKWVLPNQQSIVLMKEFLGSELEHLRVFSVDRSSAVSLNNKFKTIYDHIATPDKPTTYEAWIKSTPWSDVDHYFFAIYIANFKGANYIPVDCPNDKCKETFLSNDVPIMDMVKFDNEAAKAKFQKLYQNETVVSNPKGLYTTEIIPLSENIAVGFKEPSIYNIIEIASLDAKFKDRYSSVLDYIPFIDALYIINMQQQTLEPIGFKTYADNATKTVKSKIQKYDSILRTLSADEFGTINPYIQAINDRTVGFNYQFPAIECPKCHTSTTAQNVTAEDMVFTRCQLGKLVTTSLN